MKILHAKLHFFTISSSGAIQISPEKEVTGAQEN
jgi:hypothetical protein